MGLSASQARLLSITRRLNNNELQSELISNSKIQLANRNVRASEKYINALDCSKMEYISYNETGIKEKVALTFNALNQYNALKNQYLLYNSEGQIYINAKDAANFTKSDDLYDFLNCYGLIDNYQHNKNLQKENDEYNDLLKQWEEYYDSPEYKMYQESSAAGNPYETFKDIVGTSTAPLSCYSAALSNPLGNCYKHVLCYLINPDATQSFNTSYTGSSVNVGLSDVDGTDGPQATLYTDGKGEQIAGSMGAMLNATYRESGEPIMVCDGDDDLNSDGNQNILQSAKDEGRTATKLETLMSDYIDNGDGTYSLKSVLQKAIDMMYIIKNQSEFSSELTAPLMKNLLINFTDGDLKNVPSEPEAPAELGEKPDTPAFKITDKAKAQWYINLWYTLEGMSTPELLSTIYNEDAVLDYYTITNADKTAGNKTTFIIMEDNLASDSSWLQFGFANGSITLAQAALHSNGDINWQGVEFSSTSDITEVQDDSKISLAEAEYEKTIKEIQIEDKKLDQQIRKLDTEHSSLEKELESIKGVMDKNVERSFATFS